MRSLLTSRCSRRSAAAGSGRLANQVGFQGLLVVGLGGGLERDGHKSSNDHHDSDDPESGLFISGPVSQPAGDVGLSLIHISEPTRLGMISYAVFCLKKKKKNNTQIA